MKTAWLAYAVMLLVLGAGRMVERILSDKGGYPSRYFPLVAAATLSLGVIYSVFQRRCFSQWFWKGLFWLSVACSVMLVIGAGFLFYYGSGGAILGTGILLLSAVVAFPAQLRIKAYAYHSPAIWKATEPNQPPEPVAPSGRGSP